MIYSGEIFSKPMKTILIAHNYSEKSFSSMSFNLANHIAELGNRVIFISHKPYYKTTEIIKKGNGEVIVCSWTSLNRPTSFKDLLWFVEVFLKYKPKIIIGHFVGSNITISISKLLSFGRVKTFAYYHTLTGAMLTDNKNYVLKLKLLFFRKKIFYKLFCDFVVCPSEMAKMDLESFFKIKNGIVILNPISDRYQKKELNSNENIIISYLGRLDKTKGVIDLISAFKIFKNNFQHSKILLNIAGSGSQQNEIIALIGNFDSIMYFGSLPYDKIDTYLNESHYVIIPSKYDAFNVVGIESMMNQTPLLISNGTGLTTYLTEGKECFKFDSKVEDMVDIFEKVETNIHLQEQMGIDARKTYLKYFTINNYCNVFTEKIL